jgi:hypothetical protein
MPHSAEFWLRCNNNTVVYVYLNRKPLNSGSDACSSDRNVPILFINSEPDLIKLIRRDPPKHCLTIKTRPYIGFPYNWPYTVKFGRIKSAPYRNQLYDKYCWYKKPYKNEHRYNFGQSLCYESIVVQNQSNTVLYHKCAAVYLVVCSMCKPNSAVFIEVWQHFMLIEEEKMYAIVIAEHYPIFDFIRIVTVTLFTVSQYFSP